MCTIVMPADYEMVLAASPPVFSPATSFLGNYSGFRYGSTRSRVRLISPAAPSTLEMPIAAPRRPCLIIRPSEQVEVMSDEAEEATSPTRLKKKVVFADDKGLSLTQVRVMTEPSDCPPFWTTEFLAQVTKGVSAEVAPEPWEVTFPQPASDYLEFRRRLDTACVSLENVIVKEAEEVVMGTVKVKNLSFHKEVVVRVTFDEWKSHEDAFCTYVANGVGPTAAGYNLYDTFSFKLTIPPSHMTRRIEFCVCFRCGDEEHWDSNDGKNYILLKSGFKVNGPLAVAPVKLPPSARDTRKFHDAVHAKIDSWSEFASWNHLVNDSPYW